MPGHKPRSVQGTQMMRKKLYATLRFLSHLVPHVVGAARIGVVLQLAIRLPSQVLVQSRPGPVARLRVRRTA